MINKYYQKNKERLRNEARERYQNFTGEEKEKRRQYYQERKENLHEYRTNYLTHKKQLLGHFIDILGPGTIKPILGMVRVIFFRRYALMKKLLNLFSQLS